MESHADFQHTPSASAQSKTANKHNSGKKIVETGEERKKNSDEKVMMTWLTLNDETGSERSHCQRTRVRKTVVTG